MPLVRKENKKQPHFYNSCCLYASVCSWGAKLHEWSRHSCKTADATSFLAYHSSISTSAGFLSHIALEVMISNLVSGASHYWYWALNNAPKKLTQALKESFPNSSHYYNHYFISEGVEENLIYKQTPKDTVESLYLYTDVLTLRLS